MKSSLLLLPWMLPIIAADWIVHSPDRHSVYPLRDALGDGLVYVSFSLNDSQAIRLDYSDDQRESCVVPRPALPYNSRSRYKLGVLGNGKLVVTMLNDQLNRGGVSAGGEINKVKWWLSVVEPRNCTYRHREIGGGRGRTVDGVVAYRASFDLVGRRGRRATTVLRYRDDGELEGFSADLGDAAGSLPRIAVEYEPGGGYYRVLPNRAENAATIQRLDSEYRVANGSSYVVRDEEALDYESRGYSVTQGRLTFCYVAGRRTNALECLVLDDKLTRQLARLRLTYEHGPLARTTVLNLRDGGFVVVHVLHRRGRKEPSTVYARGVSAAGLPGRVVEIGDVAAGQLADVRAFLMSDDRICVVATTDDAALTRCVDVALLNR